MEEKKVENQKKENFFEKTKRKVKGFGKKILDAALDHPEIALPLASGFSMMFLGGFKYITGAGNKKLERCKVKDDVTEEYFLTKHPLTNDEILELGDKMIDGTSKGKALDEMGVLRKERRRK